MIELLSFLKISWRFLIGGLGALLIALPLYHFHTERVREEGAKHEQQAIKDAVAAQIKFDNNNCDNPTKVNHDTKTNDDSRLDQCIDSLRYYEDLADACMPTGNTTSGGNPKPKANAKINTAYDLFCQRENGDLNAVKAWGAECIKIGLCK